MYISCRHAMQFYKDNRRGPMGGDLVKPVAAFRP